MPKTSKNLTYLPMQKSLKILLNISSTSTFPTIIPKWRVASLRSSAPLSKSSFFFLSPKFFKCSTHCSRCCLCLSLVIKISSLLINLFFNLFFILLIKISRLEFLIIDIKTCSNFFICSSRFFCNKSDLLITKIEFSSKNQ